MTRKKAKVRRSRQLVLGYLERVSSRVFSEFPKQLTDLVAKQHGVYALYKGKRLYYVGQAGNLRSRVKQHLRDKHAGKWDKFSVYLVRKADHIKEFESLILRIADPKGNAQRGRLPRADNLRSELQSKIRMEQHKRLDDILGSKRGSKRIPRVRGLRRKDAESRQSVLAPYVAKRFKIRGTHKGIVYNASVRSNGLINLNGTLYRSPSSAMKAAIGFGANGWTFWRFKNKKGEWVRLGELRKK